MKKFVIIIFTVLLPSSAFSGGGWVQALGAGYFKFSQSVIRADRFYNPNGDEINITTVSLYTTSIYGEYGITPRLTGIVYLPVFVRTTLNDVRFRQSGDVIPGDELNSIGDAEIGLKYGFNQRGPIVFAASLTLGLPIGEDQGGESGILQTGDGEFNQKIQLEASRSMDNWYLSALVGFNNRTQDFSDELHLGLEVGYVQDRLVGLIKVINVSSFNNGDAGSAAGNTIFSNNTEYLSIAPEFNYRLGDSLGVSASAAFALSGQNVLASPNYSLGVFLNL